MSEVLQWVSILVAIAASSAALGFELLVLRELVRMLSELLKEDV